jgi:acyl-CoA thioester hydrolase
MLSGFRFTFPLEVRFRDLDALGHVNNAVYLTYLESARIAYWIQLTGATDLARLSMILARVELDFRSPARFGDELVAGVRCASLGRTSFVMEQRIEERRSERLVAEARKVLVHYDHAAARPLPIPEALRARLLAQDPEAERRR